MAARNSCMGHHNWILGVAVSAMAGAVLAAGCGSDVSFGSAHDVCLRPEGVDFGEQTIRTESTRTVAVTNCGGLPIYELQVKVVPQADAPELGPNEVLPFAVAETVIPKPVALSDHFQLTINFWPTELGPTAAELELDFPSVSATEQPVRTTLTGTGVPRAGCDARIVETAGLDFGQVRVGDSFDPPLTLTVENQGSGECQLSGTRITAGFADYSISAPPPATLATGASATFAVVFAPTTEGVLPGTVALIAREKDPDAGIWLNTELTAPLTGEGANIAICELAATPGTVIFPRATANAPLTATSGSFVLENIGGVDCTLTTTAVTAGSTHFSLTTTPSGTLTPTQTTTVSLAFAPVAAGQITGNVHVETVEGAILDVPLVSFADPTPGCVVSFDPNPLTFNVRAAGLSDDQTVTITNDAVVDCDIADITVADGVDFEIMTAPLPLGVLTPGNSIPIDVRFIPQTGAVARGTFAVDLGDPSPTVLDLLGTGDMADFVLTPLETYFLWVTEGCASEALDITLTNIGNVAGRIDSVGFSALTDPYWELVSSVAPGTMLAAGAQMPLSVRLSVPVQYTQPDPHFGGNSGSLIVQSTGTVRPQVASTLFAETESLADSVRVDIFLQTSTPTVDVLFVVDNSGSMYWAQQSLAANFAAFISYFAVQTDIDYQLGITSTDVTSSAVGGGPGYLVGPVMDRFTPDLTAEFISQVNLGTDGSYDEQGLQAGALAVSSPLADPSGPNAGFVRPDALLAVIYLSDEEDHSPGAVSDHVNTLLSVKGYRSDQVVAYAIAGDVPGGCTDAESADRYLAATVGLNGDFFSICDPDWASNLSAIAWGIGDRLTNFELTREPAINTVVVLITRADGSVYEIPAYDPNATPPEYNGWSVDPVTNIVTFHGNGVPESNERIEVSYNAKCLPR